MTATLSFNPFVATNAVGSFNIDTGGGFQGTFMDDPAIRNALAGGILATTETIPMWGGVGISELVPTPGSATLPNSTLGGIISRATTQTAASAGQLTGFSVFNQAHSMVNSPQSPVPLAGSGNLVNFFRLGSGARIWVAMDPSLVTLENSIITTQVSWDFNNQVLQPYDASTATYSITSLTWASTNGGQTTVVAAVATPVAGVGDVINISGATNTGTGGATAVNGNFTVTAFTDNQHFVIAAPAASGVIGTIAGTIVANYGVGALVCKILDINIGNSMTVTYNASTGFATWNRSGSAALILI